MSGATQAPLALPDGRLAVLRPARPSDAEGLTALSRAVIEDGRGEVRTLEDVSSVESLRAELRTLEEEGPTWRVRYVADVDGRVAGAALANRLRPGLIRHVAMLAVLVAPSHQRLGLGRALVERLVAWAGKHCIERLELYTRADNHRAIALYASLGFEHEGTRRRFVRTPEGDYVDDLVMARLL